MSVKSSYAGVRDILSRYWIAYGGWQAVLTSAYFHASILLTMLMYGSWLHEQWWKDSISILPSIIGFSLGGYAIWLSFGDEKFKRLLAEINNGRGEGKGGKILTNSIFMEVNATFVHFIVLQIFALIYALLVRSGPVSSLPPEVKASIIHHAPWVLLFKEYIEAAIDFTGHFLLVYSILSAVAATLAIFRMASWYNMTMTSKKENKK